MKIEVVQTFLTVAETRSFVGAAERLNVTQSTVSMRIRTLEEALGVPVFVRDKNGAVLTAAGARFERHARNLWLTWSHARQDAGVAPEFETVARIGAQYSLWYELLMPLVPWLRESLPRVAIQAETGEPDELTTKLSEGLIDLAVMYAPRFRTDLVVEQLIEDRLIYVTARPGDIGGPGADYVQIDWGPEFARALHDCFPDAPQPSVRFTFGALGLRYILDYGGSGYFPRRMVRPHLEAGRLFEPPSMPEFERPAYLVYSAETAPGWLGTALTGLRKIAGRAND